MGGGSEGCLASEYHTGHDVTQLPTARLRHSHIVLSGTYIFSRSPNPENAPFGMTRSLVRTNLLKESGHQILQPLLSLIHNGVPTP